MADYTPTADAQQAKVRPALTIAEATDRADLSRASIRRRLYAGRIDGAWQDDDGTWMLPVVGLIAAGVKLHASPEKAEQARTPAPTPSPAPDTAPDDVGLAATVAALRERLADVTAQLNIERRRADLAEVRAEERQTHLDMLSRAMRLIEATTPDRPDTPPPPVDTVPAPPPASRHHPALRPFRNGYALTPPVPRIHR